MGNTNARDRIDKFILIDKTEESNDEENSEAVDISTELSKYRVKNKDKIILATLNINSIRNKFSSLSEIIANNIDILVIQETKIDASFPDGQFLIPGYKKPYRRDRNCHGGGILVYVRHDIPSKEVNAIEIKGNTEGIFVELNFRKSKWLLIAAYKPPDVSKADCFDNLTKALDFHSKQYENMILMGDLNTAESDEVLFDFLEEHFLSNLVKFPTCFKSVENPSSIDLIITNKHQSFQNTTSFSTGLSDFHKLVITSMKTTFPKVVPKTIIYSNMKNFD